MKKMLVVPMIMAIILIMATTVFATSSSLAEKIYSMGAAYGVTAEHKVKIERYFAENPATEEQEAYIISKANEAIAVMDAAGTKDVTKLSSADLTKVQNLVKDAGNKVGLTVTFTGKNGTSFQVSKGNKVIDSYTVTSTDPTSSSTSKAATTSTKKFVYTGSNAAILTIASLGVMVVALGAVAKLRKNA